MSRKEDFDSFQKRFNSTGKVGKNEFSVDGKSFDYRDPKNLEYAQVGSRGDRGIRNDQQYNPNAYNFTDPLYDYSKGEVRDAAKELGIGNVDEKSEVKQILKYIQDSPDKQEEDKPKEFLKKYIDKKASPAENESTQAEVEIPSTPTASGDGSINSPISQASPINIDGDRNNVKQNNAISQEIDNSTDNSDNSSKAFLDGYRLNLGDKFKMFA